MKFKDYYRVMGVARDAPPDEIKRAYRRLARKYHPDVSGQPDAEERFKEVNEAYEVLRDPQRRAAYDGLGSDWKSGQEFAPPPGWDSTFEFRAGDADAARFSKFFEALFGAGAPFARDRASRGGARRGEDQYATIAISLEDSYHGTRRTVALQVPERDRRGRVTNRQRTLSIKIPSGITEGQRIRLAGQGPPASGAGANGDLYLEVRFTPHRLYEAIGRNLYLELPLAPWEAALGATVQVPTLGGKVDLKVPPGTQTADNLRLKGRGLPGRPPGDLYLSIRIMTPKAATAAHRRLYEEMARTMPFDPRAALEV